MPGTLTPSGFLKTGGCTNLKIPLDEATAAVQRGSSTLVLFTDGANNMASEHDMYQAMLDFYQAVQAKPACWHITFHFITVGNWWPQSTISAMSSLFGLTRRRVEVTVTDADGFLKSGFSPAIRLNNLGQFEAMCDLRNALPDDRRNEITQQLQELLSEQQRLEAQQEQAKSSVTSSAANPTNRRKLIKSIQELIQIANQELQERKEFGGGQAVLTSVLMQSALRGVRLGKQAVADPPQATLLAQLNASAHLITAPLPDQQNAQAALDSLLAGDVSPLAGMLMLVDALGEDHKHKPGQLMSALPLTQALAEHTAQRFRTQLVRPVPGVEIKAVKPLLDLMQSRFAGLQYGPQDMTSPLRNDVTVATQQLRTTYLAAVLEKKLWPQVALVMNLVADCWLIDSYPYTPLDVMRLSQDMLQDLKFTKQGMRQKFSESGDMARQLAVLWCIVGCKQSWNAVVRSVRAMNTIPPPAWGSGKWKELWLGVTGMWARFATDAEIWDLYTLLQTKINLKAYAQNLLMRSLEVKLQLNQPQLLKVCHRYASAAQLIRGEEDPYASTPTPQPTAEKQDGKEKDSGGWVSICSSKSRQHAGVDSKAAAAVDPPPLTEHEAAAIMSMCNLTDLKDLSRHTRMLIKKLKRKPHHNIGSDFGLFRALAACIRFGPQTSVRGALEFQLQTGLIDADLKEAKMARRCCYDFLTYTTSFDRLFQLPPPLGWTQHDWVELNRVSGIDLETVPLRAAVEPDEEVMRLAREWRLAVPTLSAKDATNLLDNAAWARISKQFAAKGAARHAARLQAEVNLRAQQDAEYEVALAADIASGRASLSSSSSSSSSFPTCPSTSASTSSSICISEQSPRPLQEQQQQQQQQQRQKQQYQQLQQQQVQHQQQSQQQIVAPAGSPLQLSTRQRHRLRQRLAKEGRAQLLQQQQELAHKEKESARREQAEQEEQRQKKQQERKRQKKERKDQKGNKVAQSQPPRASFPAQQKAQQHAQLPQPQEPQQQSRPSSPAQLSSPAQPRHQPAAAALAMQEETAEPPQPAPAQDTADVMQEHKSAVIAAPVELSRRQRQRRRKDNARRRRLAGSVTAPASSSDLVSQPSPASFKAETQPAQSSTYFPALAKVTTQQGLNPSRQREAKRSEAWQDAGNPFHLLINEEDQQSPSQILSPRSGAATNASRRKQQRQR
eukprot:gb/GEZN01000609.1/.p1 GENE.gb/GEZN01000609.1/~~gb/GEZN01000609.1/.p1  ORF type:complete len:1275 (+),score=288.97 gb/GEZN01000609.1/:286-3825(+)